MDEIKKIKKEDDSEGILPGYPYSNFYHTPCFNSWEGNAAVLAQNYTINYNTKRHMRDTNSVERKTVHQSVATWQLALVCDVLEG